MIEIYPNHPTPRAKKSRKTLFLIHKSITIVFTLMLSLMGYYNRKIFSICISLFFLLSLIIIVISFACATPSLGKLQHTAPVSKTELQAFQIKNDKGLHRNTMKNKKKIKRTKKFNTRLFSAMLPKGYVPPSSPSPRHNGLSAERYSP